MRCCEHRQTHGSDSSTHPEWTTPNENTMCGDDSCVARVFSRLMGQVEAQSTRTCRSSIRYYRSSGALFGARWALARERECWVSASPPLLAPTRRSPGRLRIRVPCDINRERPHRRMRCLTSVRIQHLLDGSDGWKQATLRRRGKTLMEPRGESSASDI